MVWRSQDPLLQRSVAVKLIHPRLADDPRFAQALAEEARRVAVLSVPEIARLLDTGEQDGVTYLVREYAPDRACASGSRRPAPCLRRRPSGSVLPPSVALAQAHDRGVLHLALDPDDAIVGEDGRVCLIDFGIGAAVAASRPTEAAALLGDEHLAPEQLAGTEPDARTDLYAIASLLFELLTGSPSGSNLCPGRPSGRPPYPRPCHARALDPRSQASVPRRARLRGRARAFGRHRAGRRVRRGTLGEPVHLDRRAARRGGSRDRRDHCWVCGWASSRWAVHSGSEPRPTNPPRSRSHPR